VEFSLFNVILKNGPSAERAFPATCRNDLMILPTSHFASATLILKGGIVQIH
jgi:hypothetical protein